MARRSGPARVHNFEVWANLTYFAGPGVDGPFVAVHHCTPNPFKSLIGKTLRRIKDARPKNWRTVPPKHGKGFVWSDENNVDRMRVMKANPRGMRHHERTGYVRWKNDQGEFLDEYGRVWINDGSQAFKDATHLIL